MSTNDIEATVVSALKEHDIDYEWIDIDPEYADTVAFCEKYGFSMDSSGNTIVVTSKRGEKKFCACIVKGSDRLDVNKTVRRLMGVPRASFATPDETMELTGMMIGGVTPFALPKDLTIYVDQKLMNLEYVILGAGSRSSKLKVAPDSLRLLSNVEITPGLSMSSGNPLG